MNRRLACCLVFALTAAAAVAAQPLPDWEDPQIVGINKLDPHAPVYPFADAASARAMARTQSPYYRLLNGAWRFHFSPTPEARPRHFY